MQAGQQRIYAIGDVHGRADLLEILLSAITCDAARAGVEPTIIFLGDIIDRGPDSLGALRLVESTLTQFPKSKLILGNHDVCLLAALNGTYTTRGIMKWLQVFGGMAAVKSLLPNFRGDEDDLADELAATYPNFREMLEQASRHIVIGDYCFVHAGVRPGVPLSEQTDYDLMWIREEFLDFTGEFGKIVVHGYSPTESGMPEFFFNRIAVDTGAYNTGLLSAVVLKPDSILGVLHTQLTTEGQVVFSRISEGCGGQV